MTFQKFMQLTKVDVAKHRIYGVFSAEVVDKSGEVADYDSTKKAFQEWSAECQKVSGGKTMGNVRKMHTAEIAGGVVSLEYDDTNKVISGCVEVKPEIMVEAEKGWLNGFSIGGSYIKKWNCPVFKGAKRFTPALSELSVVDNPCVPDATFDALKGFELVKPDGHVELCKFAVKPEEKTEHAAPFQLVFKAMDGTLHDTEELAIKHLAAKEAEKAAAPALDALKKLEDMANPESDEEKVKKLADVIKLEKGLCDVARCALLTEELGWLADSLAADAFWEGDSSTAPQDLKGIVKSLGDFLRKLVAEETAEAVKAAPDLTEAGVLALRKVAGNDELLKDWTPEAPAVTDDLKKIQGENDTVKAERDALKKQLDEMQPRIEAVIDGFSKRLANVEKQPLEKQQLFIVEKDDDKPVPVTMRSVSPGHFREMMS